jgi:hypothetical protein
MKYGFRSILQWRIFHKTNSSDWLYRFILFQIEWKEEVLIYLTKWMSTWWGGINVFLKCCIALLFNIRTSHATMEWKLYLLSISTNMPKLHLLAIVIHLKMSLLSLHHCGSPCTQCRLPQCCWIVYINVKQFIGLDWRYEACDYPQTFLM